MEKAYFSLRPLLRSDFASDFLFETAQELQERFLKKFENLVNQVKSPHMKHACKIIEMALRANRDTDLVIDFNEKKAEEASLKELFLETTSSQNSEIADLCFEIKKFLKSRSHSDRGEVFERSILANTGVIVEIYFNNLADPETFHREKKIWLNDFNQAKQARKLKAVRV